MIQLSYMAGMLCRSCMCQHCSCVATTKYVRTYVHFIFIIPAAIRMQCVSWLVLRFKALMPLTYACLRLLPFANYHILRRRPDSSAFCAEMTELQR